MRRSELVAQFVEAFRLHADVVHYLVEIQVGKLSVKPLDQRDAFLTGEVHVANFLGRVVRGPAKSEFDIGRVVVQIVAFVINAVVFAIRAL